MNWSFKRFVEEYDKINSNNEVTSDIELSPMKYHNILSKNNINIPSINYEETLNSWEYFIKWDWPWII